MVDVPHSQSAAPSVEDFPSPHSDESTLAGDLSDPTLSSNPHFNKGTLQDLEAQVGEKEEVRDDKTWEVERKPWYFHALFIASCVSGQAISQAQVGASILPNKAYGEWLGTTSAGQIAWFAAAYGMTLGVGVLISGQLGDRFGAKRMFLAGFLIMIISNIGSGFCKSTMIGFDITRGLAGLGGSLILPNAASQLGRAYPPGHLRTTSFAIYGAMAPAGSIAGGAVASWIVQTIGVQWCFFITAIVAAVFALLGLLILPADEKADESLPPLDYFGFLMGFVGLCLLLFAFNQGSIVGWHTPYIYSLFLVSLVVLGAFFLWERHMCDRALVPMSIWNKQSVTVLLALWFGWMSFGCYLYYTSTFLRDIRGLDTPLKVSAEMAQLAPFGILAALSLIWVFPRVEGHHIFAGALFGFFVGDLFMAVTPAQQSFWAMIFPASLVVVFGSDWSFASGSLIIANSVPRHLQGTASSLVQVVVNYALALGLSMAGTVEAYVNDGGADELAGIRGAFYFASCVAFTGFLLVLFFVRTDSRKNSGHGH